MFTTIPARSLLQKAVAVTVVGGALALGTGGAAFATTTTTSGSTPTTSHHFTCARAPKVLARIDKVEAAVTKRLPKLQAAEKRLTAGGHTTLAGKVEKRITTLQKVDTRAAALAATINAKCPTTTS